MGRRVAVYTCSCGIAGCGVVAPWIELSPDGRRISWLDPRDYVGVFNGPTAADMDGSDGTPLALPELHFDTGQYVSEVARISADGSWESPRRRLARLVEERLLPAGLELPEVCRLRWVPAAWDDEGVHMSFERFQDGHYTQHMLHLQSACEDPDDAADDIVDTLLSHDPAAWLTMFRWEEPPRR